MWHVSAIIRLYYKNIKGETDGTKEEASHFTMNNTVKGEACSLASMLSGSTVINLILRERKLILQTPFHSFWYIQLNDWYNPYRGIHSNMLLITRQNSQNTWAYTLVWRTGVHFQVGARSNSSELQDLLCGPPTQ